MKTNSTKQTLKRLYFGIGFILLFIFPSLGHSKVLFEGYYKLELGDLHIGYVIQRFQLDPKTKIMQATYFTRTIIEKESSTESLNAYADELLKPVSYQYTYKRTDAKKRIQIKTIDAKLERGRLLLLTRDGNYKEGKDIPVEKSYLSLKKNSIFSSFLTYGILTKGLRIKTSYPYTAIAEEKGEPFSGFASVVKQIKKKGRKMFQVSNDYMGSRFKSVMDKRGVIYKFQTDGIRLTGTLVKSRSQAIRGFPFEKKSIKKLFGYVPTGNGNTLISHHKSN